MKQGSNRVALHLVYSLIVLEEQTTEVISRVYAWRSAVVKPLACSILNDKHRYILSDLNTPKNAATP